MLRCAYPPLPLRAEIIDDYQRTASKKARYRTDSKDNPSAKNVF